MTATAIPQDTSAPNATALLPLFRYTGSKRRVMPAIDALLRPDAAKPLLGPGQHYFEPMLGAGAPFLFWRARGLIPDGSAVLGDASPLIAEVWQSLADPVARRHTLDWLRQAGVSAQGFADIRAAINTAVEAGRPMSALVTAPERDYALAAAVIYVVRCSYGGLLRTNRKGQLNASFAKDTPTKQPFKLDNLFACGEAVRLACGGSAATSIPFGRDYVTTVAEARADDVVYLDPPYYPESKTASFTGYVGSWNCEEHERLAQTFESLAERGVRVVMSNAGVKWVRERYQAFRIRELQGHRANNRANKTRARKVELLITANFA